MDAAVWNIKANGIVCRGHKSPGPDTSAGEQRGDKARHKLTEFSEEVNPQNDASKSLEMSQSSLN